MRGGWPLSLLALLPLLVAFDPLKSSNKDIELGNQQLKAGKAEEALGAYDKAVARLPNDPGAHFDRGAALFALSRFDEAGQEFLRATEAKDGALKATAFYNLGNAFFKKDKFKEAVEAYKRTLALDPHDSRAKWNLEIALKKQKQKEKEKEKEDEQKKKDDKDKNKDDKNKDDKNKDDKSKDDKKDKQDDKNKGDKSKDEKKDKPDQPPKKPPEPQKDDKNAEDQKKNPQEKPPEPQNAGDQEIGAVLDSLERNPKDLEKERARLRAVRRAPPPKDW